MCSQANAKVAKYHQIEQACPCHELVTDEPFLEVWGALSIEASEHHILALNHTCLFQLPKQGSLVISIQIGCIELVHVRAIDIVPSLLQLSVHQVLSCRTRDDAFIKLVHVDLLHYLWPGLIVHGHSAQVALKTEHKGIVAIVTEQHKGQGQGCELHECVPLNHRNLVANSTQESNNAQHDHDHSYPVAQVELVHRRYLSLYLRQLREEGVVVSRLKDEVDGQVWDHYASNREKETFAPTLLLVVTPSQATVHCLDHNGNHQDKEKQLEEEEHYQLHFNRGQADERKLTLPQSSILLEEEHFQFPRFGEN